MTGYRKVVLASVPIIAFPGCATVHSLLPIGAIVEEDVPRVPPVESSSGADFASYAAVFEPVLPRQAEIIYGTEEFSAPKVTDGSTVQASKPQESGHSFVFNNASIQSVVYEVLGATFDVDYTIDSNVRGAVSINVSGVHTEAEAVGIIDHALSSLDYEIIRAAGMYAIQPASKEIVRFETPEFLTESEDVSPGTTTAIVQVARANVNDLQEIASPILPANMVVHVDDQRGMLVLQGTPEDLEPSIALVRSLDVDWLSSVSIGVVPVENATASDISTELSPLIERMGGVSALPIERLNSLMVITRRRESLDRVREWIGRLDQSAETALSENTLVYEAKYVDAHRLAGVVRGQMGGFDDAGTSDILFDHDEGFGNNAPSRSLGGGSQGLYASLAIQVDTGRNAIIARGNQSDLLSLSELVRTLDQPQRQVLIEATIVEVTLSSNNQFGIQWDAVEDNLRATFSDIPSGDIASLFPGLSVSYINTDIEFVVNALASTSDAEIVSSPRLMVINNETARLQIGDQVPVITQSAVSVIDPAAPIVNSTSYRDTGVILTVSPSIRAGGMVELIVNQEVSGVAETTSSTINSPTITRRSIDSRLAVPDGSTAVLGGLMSTTRSVTETGVPILKDIPLVGRLFRSQGEVERRTELVVLLEPTVVQSSDPITDVPSRLRDALERARSDHGPAWS